MFKITQNSWKHKICNRDYLSFEQKVRSLDVEESRGYWVETENHLSINYLTYMRFGWEGNKTNRKTWIFVLSSRTFPLISVDSKVLQSQKEHLILRVSFGSASGSHFPEGCVWETSKWPKQSPDQILIRLISVRRSIFFFKLSFGIHLLQLLVSKILYIRIHISGPWAIVRTHKNQYIKTFSF